MFRIDGDYFRYKSLDKWTKKAPLIGFHYHAFNLYIALLVDAISVARDAIHNCRLTADSAKGEIRHTRFLVLKTEGTMACAHALYWEGIVLARMQENWNPDDSQRYQFIVEFFKSRAEYAPSTFRHKAIFLQGSSAKRISLNL